MSLDDDDPLNTVSPLDADDGPAAPVSEDVDLEAVAECAALPLNDYGNSLRFARHKGHDLLFVPRVGWFVWDGRRWAKDDDQLAVRAKAQDISGLISLEGPHVRLPDWQMEIVGREDEYAADEERLSSISVADVTPQDRVALARARENLRIVAGYKKALSDMRSQRNRHAKNAGNSRPITNMIEESQVKLAVPLDQLDADPLCINTETGVLRFSVESLAEEGGSRMATFTLEPHDRDQRLSKMMPVEYDPKAEAPLFEAFLARIQPHAEMRRFLQRWFGLSMTALTGEQKLVFLHGMGANGKSVLVDLMARMMGDYAATAKIESLVGRNRRSGGDATPDLVPLMGARMVRASEPEEGERLQEGIVKELTGGEPILIRALHSDFIEVRPVFKLTISGNHKPEIRGTDDGIWRRLLLVPFDVQIPAAERDPTLLSKLWAERAGILNWLIEGLRDFLEGGLQEPEAVLEATREFRQDSDPVGLFLTECALCTGYETDILPAKDLVEGFNFWLEERGDTRWTARTVSFRMRDKAGKWRDPVTNLSFAKGKSGIMVYRGIVFTEPFATRFANARATGTTRGYGREEGEM